MIHLFNRIPEKENRRHLRQNSTEAEKLLWDYLRHRKCANLKFKRQYSVRKYVLDFYCSSCRLAVELDGEVHLDKIVKAHDDIRDTYLHKLGIKVLRIRNEEVFDDINAVLKKIRKIAE